VVNVLKWLLRREALSFPWLLNSVAVQVRFLLGTLEFHLGGNHLLANAKALVFAGLFFSGGEADSWLRRGIDMLRAEMTEQIGEDGGHYERSPMYHSIVLEDLLDLYNMARCSAAIHDDKFLAMLLEKIEGMRQWLAAMIHPDGQIAFFNDAALDQAPTRRELEQYALRLGLRVSGEDHDGVTRLTRSGFVRIQTPRAVLIADVGDVGPAHLPGHAHAESLAFELSVDGVRTIVNSGISTYSPGTQREFERSTKAHSCLEVDGVSSSETWGSFRVARRARAFGLSIEPLRQSRRGYRVQCSHTGYRRLRGRVVHTRIWEIDEETLQVHDRIDGQFNEAVARFYFHPEWELAARQLTRGSGKVTIEPSVESRAERVNYHPQFGMSVPAWCVTIVCSSPALTTIFNWADDENSVLL
jgi:uncharacterized heparinase superfamily protein